MMRCMFVLSGVAGIAIGAPTEFQDAVDAAGPILWYQFNEPSGDVLNHGSLGSAFNAVEMGTLVRGAATGSGDTGMGFSRDNWLESIGASPLTGNPTFSIEMVVRLDTGGSADQYGPFLHWGEGGTGKEVYYSVRNRENNRLYAGFYNAGARMAGLTATGTWMHVVWVRVGGTDSITGTTLYINGKPTLLGTDGLLSPGFLTAGQIDVTSTEFRINYARDFLGTRHFTGTLDELALYERELTPSEIEARADMICAADLTGEGAVNTNDFFAYLTLYQAQDPAADFSPGGGINTNDFFAFLAAYQGGCR